MLVHVDTSPLSTKYTLCYDSNYNKRSLVGICRDP